MDTYFNLLSLLFKLWQRSAAKVGRSESNDFTLPLLTLLKSMKMFSTQFPFISSNEPSKGTELGNVWAWRALPPWLWTFLSSISFDFEAKPSSKRGFKQKLFVPLRARKLSRFRSEWSICDSSCLRISLGIEVSISELSREFRDDIESESKFEFKSFSRRNLRSCWWLCNLRLNFSSLTSSSFSKLVDFEVLDVLERRFWASFESLM